MREIPSPALSATLLRFVPDSLI